MPLPSAELTLSGRPRSASRNAISTAVLLDHPQLSEGRRRSRRIERCIDIFVNVVPVYPTRSRCLGGPLRLRAG